MSVTGESDVRWIGTADHELLIIDGAAVEPGVRFEFRGQLAR